MTTRMARSYPLLEGGGSAEPRMGVTGGIRITLPPSDRLRFPIVLGSRRRDSAFGRVSGRPPLRHLGERPSLCVAARRVVPRPRPVPERGAPHSSDTPTPPTLMHRMQLCIALPREQSDTRDRFNHAGPRPTQVERDAPVHPVQTGRATTIHARLRPRETGWDRSFSSSSRASSMDSSPAPATRSKAMGK